MDDQDQFYDDEFLKLSSSPSQQSIQSSRSPSSMFMVKRRIDSRLASRSGNLSARNSRSSLDTSAPHLHATVRDRNACMYNNEAMADVHFIVGGLGNSQRIPGHKYVLATGSSVFHAMFYGSLADGRGEVVIPDVEPKAFLNMLRYLYCDEIDLEPDTIMATLYVAKKYLIPHLVNECVSFLSTSLNAKNACMLLSQSRMFAEEKLTQHCWEVIEAQGEETLKAESFTDIDQDTLNTILSHETLNMSELLLFRATMRWARAECARRELEPSVENQRMVLGKTLFLLRIPTLSLEDFANNVAQSQILTVQETHDIFMYYTAKDKPLLQFPTVHRKGLKPICCRRFQSSAFRNNQWRYRGRCDSIQFMVDDRIFIAGYGLYGSSKGKTKYKVKLELKHNSLMLGENTAELETPGSSEIFPVMFTTPVQIEPGRFYTASVTLEGSELSFFGQDGLSEVQCDNVTFQFQYSSDSTNGTGVQRGQIPDIIFYHQKN